ncbi:ethanolamine ammonia-lyase subunit EutC [Sinimarinibacterium sp. CAU 1509]|uniref:ethanolamine ammonia-lyase subunit EutC n=1 Tax=Sinimarinibacterium sp. CAU 1509 TaxID=2562283 RepID=UPI0010AC08A6|nr:ethanolamine ammonia-lyase subunit EutC [Sinimarinibacterium sp. CAU 1509]TJY58314.1 ethanolamine ammonia-lyase subunit EutC [Sinimarinibacterium sp. CAU 1509]
MKPTGRSHSGIVAGTDADPYHSEASDLYARLRSTTPARIGLGRAGDALPTKSLLAFQAAHSRARDAVHAVVDFDRLATALAPHRCVSLRSRAADRAIFLRRPDLGRRVAPDDLAQLQHELGDWDAVFVVADGLSAAVEQHAAAVIEQTLQRLPDWKIAPVVLAKQARVALGDEVGAVIGARMVAVLIGERPGLSVADSLGVYLTWAPRIGCTDAARNCISNIHTDGLSHAAAADTLAWLMRTARSRELTGVALKLEAAHDRIDPLTSTR